MIHIGICNQDEIHTYATRPRRSILETMADFRGIKIPLSHLLEVLPPLRRRQFSIASSASVSIVPISPLDHFADP